jgi:hypothetical protein
MINQCKSSVKHAKHSAAKNRASKSIAEVSDFYIFAGKQESTGPSEDAVTKYILLAL